MTRVQASNTGVGLWGEISVGSNPVSGTDSYIGCNFLIH